MRSLAYHRNSRCFSSTRRFAEANPSGDGRSRLPFRVHREVFVLEMLGDARRPLRFDFFSRGIERVVSFAAFWRAAHVSSRVRKRNSRFGQASKFHGLLRCNSEWKRLRIGEADVFARKNDDASRDEAEILAGMEHFGHPVHRSFFVRLAPTLD